MFSFSFLFLFLFLCLFSLPLLSALCLCSLPSHPEPSQPPRATPATPIRSGQVAPGRFVQGPLRDPTRGPGFGRSLRCVFRSTGSAEGGGGGDEDLWVWDSRSKTRTVGLGFYFRWVTCCLRWVKVVGFCSNGSRVVVWGFIPGGSRW
jgi:hypothetical protein